MSGLKHEVIRVGTRASKLALLQTNMVIERLLEIDSTLKFERVTVTTGGDKNHSLPITKLGGVGVFVKELEEALLANEVDFVVHSLKDLPTEMPALLTLASIPAREDPRDVLVSKNNLLFSQLPKSAKIATSSLRRTAQLRSLRQDLQFIDIRGNIDTRLQKHDDNYCDAMILAAAGLLRLGLGQRIGEYFSMDTCVPAAGQGALAVECRINDKEILEILAAIDDPDVRAEINAERALLQELGGGCSVPIGALARRNGAKLTLFGCVAATDGSKCLRQHIEGDIAKPESIGKALADLLIAGGAENILCTLKTLAPSAVSPP